MSYTKISPLGQRNGTGTFDTIFDSKKYTSMQDAFSANDYVVMDFVKDENNIILFEIYHVHNPDEKKYYRLQIQDFPFGIDMIDDRLGVEIATSLFN